MTTCPDCAAVASGQHLTHRRTCPLGLALDERQDADRRWFAARPWAAEYRRAPHWGEIAELRMWGLIPGTAGRATGRVTVHQLAPGVRARRFGGVAIVSSAVTQ